MKNKKHFLFTKIDKETIKDTKVKRAIKLTLAFAFIFSLVMQLIGCISLSANAWDYNYYDEPQVSDSPTVEVVDELPESPNGNVIYIIESINSDNSDVSVIGTWLFNSQIPFNSVSISVPSGDITGTFYSSQSYYVNKNLVEKTLDSIFVSGDISDSYSLTISNDEESPVTSTRYAVGSKKWVAATWYGDYGSSYDPTDEADIIKLRTISITYLADGHEDFIAWLKANAVKQGVTSTLITTYNVYINSSWHTFDNLPQAVNSLFDGSFDSFIGSLLDSNGLLHQDIINWGDDKYERGYQQGLNDDYGKEVVLGFLSAPRDILSSFVLFEVGEVQISVWSIFTTILGVTLFIWFLKVFAGG